MNSNLHFNVFFLVGGFMFATFACCSSEGVTEPDNENEAASALQRPTPLPPLGPPPGCTIPAQSSCDSEWVPPANGTPGHFNTVETIPVTCPESAIPSMVEELVGDTPVALDNFCGNLGYPGATTPNEYVIGQQLNGTTTSGAPIGSIQQLQACTVTSTGTACDPPTLVTITNCCQPLTCASGVCGTVSDGCGGTLNCSTVCEADETCTNGTCQTAPTCHTELTCCVENGGVWVHGTCQLY